MDIPSLQNGLFWRAATRLNHRSDQTQTHVDGKRSAVRPTLNLAARSRCPSCNRGRHRRETSWSHRLFCRTSISRRETSDDCIFPVEAQSAFAAACVDHMWMHRSDVWYSGYAIIPVSRETAKWLREHGSPCSAYFPSNSDVFSVPRKHHRSRISGFLPNFLLLHF
jgi:hypothetical protein